MASLHSKESMELVTVDSMGCNASMDFVDSMDSVSLGIHEVDGIR